LGIFLLAFFIKFVKGNAVFIAAIITQVTIILTYYFVIYSVEQAGGNPVISYLWLNLIGCVLVMGIAILLQSFSKGKTFIYERRNH
jgi:hypothetical protein